MEIEMEMAPSFETRVSRAFGSLSSDLDASHSSSPFWTITEQQHRQQQIDRRSQWRQWSEEVGEESGEDDDGDAPCAVRYEKFLRLQRGECEEAGTSGAEWENEGNRGAGKRINCDGATGEGNGAVERADSQDGDEEEEEEEEKGGEDEVQQIRMMIGMDETLDFEDEEDEYDKVAVGREAAGDRIYMKEICGSDSMQSSLAILPRSLYEMKQIARDSRANHSAAAARLAEDARVAAANGDSGLHQTNGQKKLMNKAAIRPALKGAREKVGEEFLEGPSKAINQKLFANGSAEILDVSQQGKQTMGQNLMEWQTSCSIASKGVNDCPRSKKRVRFAEDSLKDDSGNFSDEEDYVNVLLPRGSEVVSGPQNISTSDKTSDRCSKVPDHVKHPWKYTHYTLDWSDDAALGCESENIKAFQAVRGNIKTSFESSEQHMEIPKSISFLPRYKQVCESKQMSNNCKGDSGATKVSNVERNHLLTPTAGIAAGIDNEKDAYMLSIVDPLSPPDSDSDSDNIMIENLSGRVKASRQQRNYRSRKS